MSRDEEDDRDLKSSPLDPVFAELGAAILIHEEESVAGDEDPVDGHPVRRR
jgi:hypothetical protein